MQRLLINRIPVSFEDSPSVYLVVKATNSFALSKNKAEWIRDKISVSERDSFIDWMNENKVEQGQQVETEFKKDALTCSDDSVFCIELQGESWAPFKQAIFKQELGRYFQRKRMFIEPIRKFLNFSAYQKVDEFNQEYDQYRRVDFYCNPSRNELSFNFGSERTLITKTSKILEDNQLAFDVNKLLVHKAHGGVEAKTLCPKEISRQLIGAPQKFNYKNRFAILKQFSVSNLYDFSSSFFSIDKSGFKYVNPDDSHNVFRQKNLMAFANQKTAINAVIGMREYGPLKKASNPQRKRLLFVYQNRNDANTLYRYLKNGLKHFPGLLSYVGIPVALAVPDKGLLYKDAVSLPDDLSHFLREHYPESLHPDTLAIIIGPFKKYESGEEESSSYYQVKKILLDKGITSQFISSDTINNYGVHYSLPNVAIAILAKFGGVPWKLSKKKASELIIGFNTKWVEGDQYLGSAVFFDNEGRLGAVKGLSRNDRVAIIKNLKFAITEYTNQVGMPERLIIHYYKPPSKYEIKNILELLKEMALDIPIAVVEVNDSKSKLDICFDADFGMGMPESGVFVKTGYNEYLLFNNNRYKKAPPQKIDDELPIKLRLYYVNTGGFHFHELIAQVYEFSRLNWKGLRQRSVPVTITYSKTIAEFSSYFGGVIPRNEVANKIPWFI